MRTKKEHIKNNWKEIYKDEILEFLNNNFPKSEGEVGYDLSFWINIESGHIWEERHPSSNWMFQNSNDMRMRIAHFNNYNESFYGWKHLVGTESTSTIEDNLSCKLPKKWDNKSYEDQIEWIEKNIDEEILDNHNEINREQSINNILEHMTEDSF